MSINADEMRQRMAKLQAEADQVRLQLQIAEQLEATEAKKKAEAEAKKKQKAEEEKKRKAAEEEESKWAPAKVSPSGSVGVRY